MLSHKTKLTLKTDAHLILSHRHHPCLEFHMIQTTSNLIIQDELTRDWYLSQGYYHFTTAQHS